MTVKQIMQKYHAKVPFPWSAAKTRKAGYKPEMLISDLCSELKQASDAKKKENKKLIAFASKYGS